MTKSELIQLVEKLIRQMPMVKDLDLLKAGIQECFALPPEPGPPRPKFDRNAYQRELMRKRRAKARINPFG